MSEILTVRLCTGPCGRELPRTPEFFSPHAQMSDGLQPRCRECCRAQQKLYNLAHPEKKKERDKKYAEDHPDSHRVASLRYSQSEKGKKNQVKNWLENKYGLTEEQYQELWNRQNGLCAICRKPEETTERLHLDHDHETKRVRGLLCGKCNRGLGMFDDAEVLLQKAIEYLRSVDGRDDFLKIKTDFNPRRRDDLSLGQIKDLRASGTSFKNIGKAVGASSATVRRRLLS
jgi:hypothetical protein